MGGRTAGQQGNDRAAGPGEAQRLQQRGDSQRVVEAGVGGGPAGQDGDRVAGPASRNASSKPARGYGLSRLAWATGSRASKVVTTSPAPAASSSRSSEATAIRWSRLA